MESYKQLKKITTYISTKRFRKNVMYNTIKQLNYAFYKYSVTYNHRNIVGIEKIEHPKIQIQCFSHPQ